MTSTIVSLEVPPNYSKVFELVKVKETKSLILHNSVKRYNGGNIIT